MRVSFNLFVVNQIPSDYIKYTKKVITDTIKEQIKKLKEDYENK